MRKDGGRETPLNKSELRSKPSVSRLFLLVTEDQLALVTGGLARCVWLNGSAPSACVCVCTSVFATRGIPSITHGSRPKAQTMLGIVGDVQKRSSNRTVVWVLPMQYVHHYEGVGGNLLTQRCWGAQGEGLYFTKNSRKFSLHCFNVKAEHRKHIMLVCYLQYLTISIYL